MIIYSTTATVYGWGSRQNARRVPRRSLTTAERAAIASGQEVRITGAPAVGGVTERRIVCVNGNYYTRMPSTPSEDTP
jgi:hypothetical protein